MQLIHTTPDLSEILLLKNILEGEGVATLVKNEYFMGLPLAHTQWPELWVLKDTELNHAKEIIAAYTSNPGETK